MQSGCSVVSDCKVSTSVCAGKPRLYELYVVNIEIAWLRNAKRSANVSLE
jgi:hypothetical protein